MKLCFLFLAFPFLLHATIIWQADTEKPFALTIQIDSEEITLDRSFHVKVTLHYPSSYEINMDSLIHNLMWTANPLLPQWRLIKSKTSTSPVTQGIVLQQLSIQIVPLKEGSLEASFLTIHFFSNKKEEDSLLIPTPVFALTVLPPQSSIASLPLAPFISLEPQFPLGLTPVNRQLLIDNPRELFEEKKSIQGYLEKHSFPWLSLVILIGSVGIVWVAYLGRDRWIKWPATIKLTKTPTPKEKIDFALQTKKFNHLNAEEKFQFYHELASILLDSLQLKFGWETTRLTSIEVIEKIKKESSFPAKEIDKLRMFLIKLDEVKFGAKQPSSIEMKETAQHIQAFIHELSASSR